MNHAVILCLLFVHALLLVWGGVGMIEWLAGEVPWSRVSNAAFPRWVLLLHWLAILTGAIAFLAGYAMRWRRTPQAMIVAYSVMAVVCVIETFWFLSGDLKFVAMVLEFSAYIGILLLLHRFPPFVTHFSAK